jgi:hypothetical protein
MFNLSKYLEVRMIAGKNFHRGEWLALALTVLASVLVIQYSLSRGGKPSWLKQPVVIHVRVPRPLPDLINQISPGDAVKDSQGQTAGRVLALSWTQPWGSPKVAWAGTQDLLMDILLENEIPLVRDEPGFVRSPAHLVAGVWSLITTDKVECSALVVRVEPLPPSSPVLEKPAKP